MTAPVGLTSRNGLSYGRPMIPGKTVQLPTELLARYDRLAEHENEARERAGLSPISGLDLLHVVAARFAGLPTPHDVDLDAIRAREGLSADMTTPPHGGRASLHISDPPNPPIDDDARHAPKGSTS